MTNISKLLLTGTLALGLLGAVGCGAQPQASPAPTTSTTATSATAANTANAAAPTTVQHVHLYLSILTGGMVGKKGWPEYVPADFTVPANAIVDVTIRDFDDGPAGIPAGYNKVVGTIGGTMKVIKAINGNVDATAGTTVSQISAKDVAHTFSFDSNGFKLSVPIPPLSTVEFSFQTPPAGTYTWQCYAACGTGASGWQGAMATDGWMKGLMTVK